MLPHALEIYDGYGAQYQPAYRNLQFAKSLFGGEDLWMTFMLDRSGVQDYPDVGYGHKAILRHGLAPIFTGEMRQIDTDLETITIKCLGNWVYLDDYGYGGQGKLWCDSRYEKWIPVTSQMRAANAPEKYRHDNQNRIYMAPITGETYSANIAHCDYYYYCPYGQIRRISFDYKAAGISVWELRLYSNTGTPGSWGASTSLWSCAALSTAGVKDITLPTPRSLVHFRLYWNNLPAAEYAGETGVTVYAEIFNLRVWGENGPFSRAIENPSVIHVAEDIARPNYLVKDTFVDANGTSLDVHAPEIDMVGSGWTEVNADFDINALQARHVALDVGNVSQAVINAGVSDCIVRSDVITLAAGVQYPGILFRYVDTNNLWQLRLDIGGSRFQLWREVGGGWANIFDVPTGVLFDGTFNLMAKLKGDRIDCYLNGIWRGGINDNSHQTATRYGIRCGAAGHALGLRWDNFEVLQSKTPVLNKIDGRIGQISTDLDRVQESLFVRDTFLDIAGTSLDAHNSEINKQGSPWVESVGDWDIQARQANVVAGVPALAQKDTGISDGIISVDTTTPSAGNFTQGIIFRFVDANNCWRFDMTHAGNIRLGYWQAAAYTGIFDTIIGVERGFTYNLIVKLRGDRIDCYLGGIWRGGTNNSFNQTATRHGMRTGDVTGLRFDNFEVYQALPIWSLFYEQGQSCHAALEDVASFGDWGFKALGWGVESGGGKVFLRQANRSRIRYTIPPEYAIRLSATGQVDKDFVTEGWAQYIDEDGQMRYTSKYYAHIMPQGIIANTVATGDDLASKVYGVQRDRTLLFGQVDADLAVEYLRWYLVEHAYPQIRSSWEILGPVQDWGRGGIWIEPWEMEMGHMVQIPHLRAVEAEGIGADLRDFDTTFLLVGMQFNTETGAARLIPEGASEDLARIMEAAKRYEREEIKQIMRKRV